MAEKRMLTKKVTEDDNFIALSSSAQALYLHLSMSADDDGFSNQVTVSMFRAHASVQDLEALLEKRYIYQFENGVIVIKHWRMANALRKDRYTPTAFQEELAKLELKDNGSYTWLPDGCRMVAERLPQNSIDKNSIDKNSIDKFSIDEIREDKCIESSIDQDTHIAPAPPEQKHTHGEYKHVRLKDAELDKLVNEYGQETTDDCIRFLDEYIEMKGYKAKNHYLCIKKWVLDAVKEQKRKSGGSSRVADQLERSYAMMSNWAGEGG